jgi:hypothetical protein
VTEAQPVLTGTYPFGEPLRPLTQEDRTPKRVFVLCVYASAVHARWFDQSGKLLVRALAVAAEPVMFWDGSGVDDILERIKMPAGAGRLETADANMNGPARQVARSTSTFSSRSVTGATTRALRPRPAHLSEPSPKKALDREYAPRATKLGLPAVDLPPAPKNFADDRRREEVLRELEESRAELLVLFGDELIRHWLSKFDDRRTLLLDFGDADDDHDHRHEATIAGKKDEALALVHPRQAAGLGAHSSK